MRAAALLAVAGQAAAQQQNYLPRVRTRVAPARSARDAARSAGPATPRRTLSGSPRTQPAAERSLAPRRPAKGARISPRSRRHCSARSSIRPTTAISYAPCLRCSPASAGCADAPLAEHRRWRACVQGEAPHSTVFGYCDGTGTQWGCPRGTRAFTLVEFDLSSLNKDAEVCMASLSMVSQRHPAHCASRLFFARFPPFFSAVHLRCPASWRREGENGRKMAENGRETAVAEWRWAQVQTDHTVNAVRRKHPANSCCSGARGSFSTVTWPRNG